MSSPFCTEKLEPMPGDDDPYTYECNRKVLHKTLHAHINPDGTTLAIWCTCGECNTPTTDLEE